MLNANFDFNTIPTNYFDLCIVGTGPAGITLANELAASNKKIIVLEGGNESYHPDSQELYAPAIPPTLYEDTTFDRVRMLGGSSNHWENNTSEYLPSDFAKKEWIKNSDWPINYEDVAQHYPLAGIYCGTDSDGYEPDYWHNKLNIKDPLHKSKHIRTGIKKAPKTPTRFFTKYSKLLLENPNITFVKNANLKDIEYDSKNKRVKSLRFVNYKHDGFTIFAKDFTLCLGGIENARYLHLFNEKYNNQIGNRFDLVGRFFMDHPLLRATQIFPMIDNLGLLERKAYTNKRFVSGFIEHNNESIMKNQVPNLRIPIFKASEYKLSTGIESSHVLAQAWQDKDMPDKPLSHIANILTDFDMVLDGIYRKKKGTPLFSSSTEFAGYESLVMFEQLPHHDNRIFLGDSRDRLGLKRHRVTWQFHDEDIKLGWKSLEIIAAELALHKVARMRILQEFEDRLQREKLFVCHHHMGTTRMASREEKGVVDANLKVFNTENLYVAGSSVFVTGSHIPPTLTVVALSIRLAEVFKGKWNV